MRNETASLEMPDRAAPERAASEQATEERGCPTRADEGKPYFWDTSLSRLCGTAHPGFCSAKAFAGRIDCVTIGRLRLCRIETSRDHVASSADPVRVERQPVIKVIFQLDGHSIYEQGGERLVVSPGDCLVYDLSHPYIKTVSSRSRYLVVVIPKDIAMLRGFSFGTISAQRFSARQGVGRVACGIVMSAFEERPTIAAACEAELAQTILNLLYLPLSQSAARGHSQMACLTRQVKALIHANLRDPELSIGRIAAVLKCSKRYLHMAFSIEGMTITDYIWMARLEQCLLELADPPQPTTITEIAFSWGFSSSSHFSHVFKKRFGFPPSELHKGLREAAA